MRKERRQANQICVPKQTHVATGICGIDFKANFGQWEHLLRMGD